jgi:hypothetical protein
MTHEERQRAERLAKRLMAYAEHGIPGAVYALCCELDAIRTAALAVRTFYALEVAGAGADVPPDDRLKLMHIVMDSVRVTTMATTAMTVLEPLIRGPSILELERALQWMVGPNGPSDEEGIKRFCEQIATAGPAGGTAAERELLQRIYDSSPDQDLPPERKSN